MSTTDAIADEETGVKTSAGRSAAGAGPRGKYDKHKLTVQNNRSRITNNPMLVADLDMRTPTGRRFRDIIRQVVADHGGIERCSETRLQLIRRFAATAVVAEMLEAKLVVGASLNIEKHTLLCATLTRIAKLIGIERRAKEVVPTLEAYLEQTYGTEQENAEP